MCKVNTFIPCTLSFISYFFIWIWIHISPFLIKKHQLVGKVYEYMYFTCKTVFEYKVQIGYRMSLWSILGNLKHIPTHWRSCDPGGIAVSVEQVTCISYACMLSLKLKCTIVHYIEVWWKARHIDHTEYGIQNYLFYLYFYMCTAYCSYMYPKYKLQSILSVDHGVISLLSTLLTFIYTQKYKGI